MTNVATKIPDHFRPTTDTSTNALNFGIQSALSKIIQFVNENDLQVSNDLFLKNLSEFDYSIQINVMSKNGKKKLTGHLYRLNNKITMRKINSFIRFIRERFQTGLNLAGFIISASKKEQEIIDARNKFKDLKAQMKLAHKDYIDKKKSYYVAGGKYLA